MTNNLSNNEQMRILFITGYYKPAYKYGGPIQSISALCESLSRNGTHVTVVTTNANGKSILDVPINRCVEVDGVQVIYHKQYHNGLGFSFSPALGKSISEKVSSYDIVVIESLWGYPLITASAYCNNHNIPYVIPLRGQLLPWAFQHKIWKKAPYFYLVARKILNKSAALHCTDPIEVNYAQKLGLNAPVIVLPNGLDISRYKDLPQRGLLREKFSVNDADALLLFLGRLHKVKNPHIAIESLASLTRKDVHLVLVGPDEQKMEPKLISLAKKLGVSNRVHFTGLLNEVEVKRALVDSDLLIMPSSQESFGMAAAEALAAGLPVITSDKVPVGHLAQKFNAGYVVPCSVNGFTNKVNELLENTRLLHSKGENASKLAENELEINVITKKMIGHYKDIIKTNNVR